MGYQIIPSTSSGATFASGMMMPYAGTSAPTGWLLCDGTFISQATYASLFAITGHAYNAGVDPGDGTFKLPDLRGRHPLGKAAAGTGSTLGGTGGSIDHTHTGPSHQHNVTGISGHSNHAVTQPADHSALTNNHSGTAVGTSAAGSAHSHSVTTPTGAGSAHQHTAGTLADATSGSGVKLFTSSASGVSAATLSGSVAAESAHTHAITTPTGNESTHTHAAGTVTQPSAHGAISSHTSTAVDAHSAHAGSVDAGGTGATGTNNAPFQAVNFIIKT